MDEAKAEALGFDPARLERARELCRAATESGEIPAVALAVARRGRLALNEAWGKVTPVLEAGTPASRPATPETIWLIASVTKPMVCAGIGLLVERGALALDDPVSRFLPEFQAQDRAGMRVRHLLTHTSGLPDMLPENVELRQRHAPAAEFARRACSTPLLFPPGTRISYQSMGIALLGAIIERLSGATLREFMRREFFRPLGMEGCALGWRPEFSGKSAAIRLPVEGVVNAGGGPSAWDWNSRYWRDFGAPWGGMHARAAEFARFMQMLLAGGVWEGHRTLGAATVRELSRNQTADLPDLPEAERRRAAWGLGWRMAADRESDVFGDLVSPRAYGHGGATGTGVWNDPETSVSFVLFTNQPGCGRFIGLIASAVAAAAT